MGKSYALYTGCTAKESTPELLKSTLAVASALDITFLSLNEASCCGASHLQDFDDFLSLVLNARNICYAEKLGVDIVTLCNTCQLNLAITNKRLKEDEKLKAKVNEKLKEVGLEYKGSIEVKHFLYAIRDDIGFENLSKYVKKPLTNFNSAAFYGCHNIRPTTVQNTNESPYRPTSIDDLAIALGAKPVDYTLKNSCCGFHVDLQSPTTSRRLTGNALCDAIDNGADFIVTPCPLCHLNMDVQQRNASKEMGRDINIPILHLSQMIGMAFGMTKEMLGLQHNIVSVDFIPAVN
jgi:succinate dehydrogenase / fumarate reductase cytochrome b subunit